MTTNNNCKKVLLVAIAMAIILGIGATMMQTNEVSASCQGDPHDSDSPTANPHDDGETGNPHDSNGHHSSEGDNCNGAQ